MDVSTVSISDADFKENFESKLSEYEKHHQGSHRTPWTAEKIFEVINNIQQARVAVNFNRKRTAMDYYWMSKYDILTIENEDHLIFKRKTPDDPTVRIISRNEYFDLLHEIHKSCGHGGRDKMIYAMKSKFYLPRKAIEIYIELCPTCKTKRSVPKKANITRPIITQDFNIGGYVDLVDFQSYPDGEFKWLLNYQDNATKFVSLRPLKTNSTYEVATELMKIFLTFGAPSNLQSDIGDEYTAKIVEDLTAIWPECNIIHESPRSPQTQKNIDRSNQDVENMLRSWMSDNKSPSWSLGCYHVQYKKNVSFQRIIGRSPFKALFGNEPKADFSEHSKPSADAVKVEREGKADQGIRYSVSGQSCNTASESEINASDIERKPNMSKKPWHSDSENSENGATVSNICDGQADFVTEQSLEIEIKTEPYYSNDLDDEYDTTGVLAQQVADEKAFEESEDIQTKLTCVVCHNPCTDSCSSCKVNFHIVCGLTDEEHEGNGTRLLCFLCKNEQDLHFQ